MKLKTKHRRIKDFGTDYEVKSVIIQRLQEDMKVLKELIKNKKPL